MGFLKTILMTTLASVFLFIGAGTVVHVPGESGTIGAPQVTTAPTPTEVLQATATPTPTPTKSPEEYTYQEMDSVMYATSNVNVRSLPSTSGTKLATVEKGTEVQITGKCNEASWYRVKYEGKTAYISANYLSTEKPFIPTPTPTPVVKYANSLYVTEGEEIYVLDSYGPKIVKFEGEKHTDIMLSESVLPIDMVFCNQEFYVYDEILEKLQVYTVEGICLLEVDVPLSGDYVKWFEEKNGQTALLTYGGKRLVFERTTGVFTEESMQITCKPVDGYDYAEIIGYDAQGNVYTANTVLVKDCSVIAGEIAVYGMTADGTVLGGSILPMLEYAYLPERYVHVTESGMLYALIPAEKECKVERLSLSAQPKSNLTAIAKKAKSTQNSYIRNSKNRLWTGYTNPEPITFTREEIYERVLYLANYKWTLAKKNTKTAKYGDVVLPRYIAAIAKENEGKSSWKAEMTGIPYCWGGFVSPYRNERNQFDTLISKDGYAAGNINTEGFYLWGTAGLDCSGFAGAVFGYSEKPSTTRLSDIGVRIKNVKELQLMDLLVAPGDHVILFCEWIDEGTWLVAESAIRAGKVIVHPMSLNSLVVVQTYQMNTPW